MPSLHSRTILLVSIERSATTQNYIRNGAQDGILGQTRIFTSEIAIATAMGICLVDSSILDLRQEKDEANLWPFSARMASYRCREF